MKSRTLTAATIAFAFVAAAITGCEVDTPPPAVVHDQPPVVVHDNSSPPVVVHDHDGPPVVVSPSTHTDTHTNTNNPPDGGPPSTSTTTTTG